MDTIESPRVRLPDLSLSTKVITTVYVKAPNLAVMVSLQRFVASQLTLTVGFEPISEAETGATAATLKTVPAVRTIRPRLQRLIIAASLSPVLSSP